MCCCYASTNGQGGQRPSLVLSSAVGSATSQVLGLLKTVEKVSITLLPESIPHFYMLKPSPGRVPAYNPKESKSQNTQGHILSRKKKKTFKKKRKKERFKEGRRRAASSNKSQLSPKKVEDPKSQCTWESFSSISVLSILQGAFAPLKVLVSFACPKFLSSVEEQLCFHFNNQSQFQWP